MSINSNDTSAPDTDAATWEPDDDAVDAAAVEAAISQHLAAQPPGSDPAELLSLAHWLNERLDEGASAVIEDPQAFRSAWQAELSLARAQGSGALLGLAGYPPFGLGTVTAPECHGDVLVFFVRRHASRLPLKVSVSLKPPHLPALYERLPAPADDNDAAAGGWSPE